MTNRDPFADFVNSEEFDSMDDFDMTPEELRQKVILIIKEIGERMEREGDRKVILREVGAFNSEIISSVAKYSSQGYVAQALPSDEEFENVDLNSAIFEVSYHELVEMLTVYGNLLMMVLNDVYAEFDQ